MELLDPDRDLESDPDLDLDLPRFGEPPPSEDEDPIRRLLLAKYLEKIELYHLSLCQNMQK